LVLDYRARRPVGEEPAAAPPFVPAADRAPEPKPARPAPPSRRPEPKLAPEPMPEPEPEPAAAVAEKDSSSRAGEPAGCENAAHAEEEPAVERSGPGVPVLG